MKDWKTTLAGTMMGIGQTLQASEDVTIRYIGIALSIVSSLILGYVAKDASASQIE